METNLKSPPDKEDLGGFPFVPYDTSLKELARENRKKPTLAEKAMWELLRNKKFDGIKFHRQKPLHDFIADYYSSQLKLVIEIDGVIHTEKKSIKYDKERTAILNSYGIKVIRYTNNEVLNDYSELCKKLKEQIEIRRKELN